MDAKPRFFETSEALRSWFKKHHAKAASLYFGYFKRHAGRRGITWPESVAEALCFGWIDGVRRRLDDDRYVVRFTPRKAGSIWSAVNIRLFGQLEAAGRMTDAGRAAFAARTAAKSKVYSYEQKSAGLDDACARLFKKNKAAWAFFESQAPSYRKKACWWVMSAKQVETRNRRLTRLVSASAGGKRLA
jgi:uncharacterized protein YdeI (YjbR/CyaY-like superfamily)